MPPIKPSIFTTAHLLPHVKRPDYDRLDYDYSNNYRIATDFAIIAINWQRI